MGNEIVFGLLEFQGRRYPQRLVLLGQSLEENSNEILQINNSHLDFHEWRNLSRSGLDMRHGIDLAEVGPFYPADGGISVYKLAYLQDCLRLLTALNSDSLSILQKAQLIHLHSHLFPPNNEHLDSSDEITGTRLFEGGLLDDWNFNISTDSKT